MAHGLQLPTILVSLWIPVATLRTLLDDIGCHRLFLWLLISYALLS